MLTKLNNLQMTGRSTSHLMNINERVSIHKDVAQAWQSMQQAAKSDGFTLEIASSFRDFSRQLSIWNRKFNGELPVKNSAGQKLDLSLLGDEEKVHAIMLYSALPGTSRHHWGTDLDVYSSQLLPSGQSLQLEPWEYESGGYFYQLATWLNENAADFGFFFPYQAYQQGVAAEPWHISFAPLALDYLDQLNQEIVIEALEASDICGKKVILSSIDHLFERYVNNITKPSQYINWKKT